MKLFEECQKKERSIVIFSNALFHFTLENVSVAVF